jgi:hypothetical protein
MSAMNTKTFALVVALWQPLPVLAQDVPGAINPNVTQANVQTTICVKGWTKAARPSVSVTNAIKRELLAEAGGGNVWEFELDHVIPLDLGGAPLDRKNLQLQAWGGSCNARQKDALEVKLSRMVCVGEMTLEAAQDEISVDWREAYELHFRHDCN